MTLEQRVDCFLLANVAMLANESFLRVFFIIQLVQLRLQLFPIRLER